MTPLPTGLVFGETLFVPAPAAQPLAVLNTAFSVLAARTSALEAEAVGDYMVYAQTLAWTDAAPITLFTVPLARYASLVTLNVTTPFDGAGAMIEVGTPGFPGYFVTFSDLGFASKWEHAVRAVGDGILTVVIRVTPGVGATGGAATLAVYETKGPL